MCKYCLSNFYCVVFAAMNPEKADRGRFCKCHVLTFVSSIYYNDDKKYVVIPTKNPKCGTFRTEKGRPHVMEEGNRKVQMAARVR